MATGVRAGVCCLMVVCLAVCEVSCRPTAADAKTDGGASAISSADKQPAASVTGQRTSRLQKPPTQALNTGFDEIVVESNLQVHRGASKSKSKITLPNAANSSSTAASSAAQNGGGNKSTRSLEV